jgi:3-oxoacyl-[acyl-carrier-protein] synthase-3
MGAFAARDALAMAGVSLESIDLIVNASGTVEQSIPDGGALLQRALGLGKSGIPAMSVHATCMSFLAALEMLGPVITAGRYRRVLVVSSDIGSAGLDPSDPESSILFGDGAAAAVLVPSDDTSSAIITSHFETYGIDAELACVEGGGTRNHPSDEDVRPEQNLFHMRGPELLRHVLGRARPFLRRLFDGLESDVMSNAIVVPHQPSIAGIRMLHSLGFGEERVVTTLETLGNCVAASIPLTLYEAISSGRIKRGEPLIFIGTGAGVSIGGAVLRY